MVDEKKTEPSVNELKVLAYDTLAQIDALQKRLGQINQAIAAKSRSPVNQENESNK